MQLKGSVNLKWVKCTCIKVLFGICSVITEFSGRLSLKRNCSKVDFAVFEASTLLCFFPSVAVLKQVSCTSTALEDKPFQTSAWKWKRKKRKKQIKNLWCFKKSPLISTVPSSTRRYLVPLWPANSGTDQATQTKAPFILFLQPPRVLKQASNSHSCGKRSTACKHFEGLLGLSRFISSVCERNQMSQSEFNFWWEFLILQITHTYPYFGQWIASYFRRCCSRLYKASTCSFRWNTWFFWIGSQ